MLSYFEKDLVYLSNDSFMIRYKQPVLNLNYMCTLMTKLFLLCVCFSGAESLCWQYECCEVFAAVSPYTREASGATLSYSACLVDQHACMNLQIVHQFITHTKSLLQAENVMVQDTKIELCVDKFFEHTNTSTLNSNLVTKKANFMQLVTWAFLGRVVSNVNSANEMDNEVKLIFDSEHNTLQFSRPLCVYNKKIYSAIIVSSVAFLIFFISMQLIEKDKQMKQIEASLILKFYFNKYSRCCLPRNPAHNPAHNRHSLYYSLNYEFDKPYLPANYKVEYIKEMLA